MSLRRAARTVAVAAALALAPAAGAQSALDQLYTVCRQSGGDCSPNVPAPPAPTRVDRDEREERNGRKAQPAAQQRAAKAAPPVLSTEKMIQAQLVGGLLQGLLTSILSSGADDGAAARAAAAERQRQEALLLQQRAAAVQEQRTAREAENARGLEDLSAALSDPWVGNAAAEPVRLEGRTVGLFAPPVRPGSAPPPPTAAQAASARLAQKAAESADVAVLASRLGTLEERLTALRQEAVGLKREMKGTARELDFWGGKVAEAVEDAKERGLAMAAEGLFTLEAKALSRLGEVQSNGRAWNRLTGMLKEADGTARTALDAAEQGQQLLDDARFALARRDLQEDVKFLAGRLGGKYAELGGSILTSAQSIRTELQAWRAIDQGRAAAAGGAARVARLQAEYELLVKDVRAARQAVSAATGIEAKDLVRGAPEPTRPTGIGSYVPHPDD